MFAWLPVESIIHDRQDEYYAAINRSNYEGESTAFIEFMLSAIQEALMEAVETSGVVESMTTDELRWYKIERFLKKNGTIVYLELGLSEIERRLGDIHTRGVAMKNGTTVAELYEERKSIYEKYADITLNCSGLTAEQCVDRIMDMIK
jgi:shikimate kinase